MKENLSESLEDYLEVIYEICGSKGAARVKDVAGRMDVASASVNNALQNLVDRGLVEHTPYDLIALTDKGKDAAKKVITKHAALKSFLRDVLLIDEKESEDSACRIEHAISDTILERIAFLTDFLVQKPDSCTRWEAVFGRFCDPKSFARAGSCKTCPQK
jgi:DtxR family transcriptional regulator, Mn-dependent transcriptional regulator